jgi:hypothetical protein
VAKFELRRGGEKVVNDLKYWDLKLKDTAKKIIISSRYPISSSKGQRN